MGKGKYFKLFASCINVKGAKSSIIMDLQRMTYLEIPNLLNDILNINNDKTTVRQLKKHFDDQYNKGINSYFKYFSENEYGFFTHHPQLFPLFSNRYITPYNIMTCVMGINNQFDYDVKDVFLQIKDLGCQSLQIRIPEEIDYQKFFNNLKVFEDSRLRIIELYLENNGLLRDFLFNYTGKDSRLFFYIMGSVKNGEEKLPNSHLNVIYIKDKLNMYPKEVISGGLFTINIAFYLEALNYNVGLHRKIAIDYNGDIKNYIDHDIVYGNTKTTPLKNLMNNHHFQEKWHVHNDKIEVCKDCQYRYMCLSNSDIIVHDGKYYKKAMCKFDPYKNEWNTKLIKDNMKRAMRQGFTKRDVNTWRVPYDL